MQKLKTLSPGGWQARNLLVLAVLMLAASGLVAASSANAGTAYFCPAGLGSITIGANDRCVGPYYSTLDQVKSTLTNGGGVSHCAVSKSQSDGLGANVIPSQCNTAQDVMTSCYGSSGGLGSYPVQINQSASSHSYYGTLAYYPNCLASF